MKTKYQNKIDVAICNHSKLMCELMEIEKHLDNLAVMIAEEFGIKKNMNVSYEGQLCVVASIKYSTRINLGVRVRLIPLKKEGTRYKLNVKDGCYVILRDLVK